MYSISPAGTRGERRCGVVFFSFSSSSFLFAVECCGQTRLYCIEIIVISCLLWQQFQGISVSCHTTCVLYQLLEGEEYEHNIPLMYHVLNSDADVSECVVL